MRTHKEDSLFSLIFLLKLLRFHGLILAVAIIVIHFINSYVIEELIIAHQEQTIEQNSPLIIDEAKRDCQSKKISQYLVIVYDPSFNLICSNQKLLTDKATQQIQRKFRGINHSHLFHLVLDKTYGSYIVHSDPYLIVFGVDTDDIEQRIERYHLIFYFVLLPFFVILYIGLLWLGIPLSKTLKLLLAQISYIEKKLPPEIKNKFFYSEQDWDKIEHAIQITDLKISEQLELTKNEHQKNKIILESIPEPIFAIKSDKKALFLNSKFISKFIPKIENEGEINLFTPQLSHEIYQKYIDVLKTGLPEQVKEVHLVFDQRDQYFDLRITPIIDSNQNTVGAAGVFHNITERKLAEQMRVDFVANVSHEIKTPLTSIKGYAQLIESDKNNLPSNFHPFLQKIISNTEKLHALFNDLLTLSMIESTRKIKKEQWSLDITIDNIKDSLQSVYPEKDIQINLSSKTNEIWVNPPLFEQVLANLLENSCKYSSSESVLVDIKIEEAKEFDILIFTDHGQGVSSEHLDRIFERFYRVNSARSEGTQKNSHASTGLGLSIVKQIIHLHQGKIRAVLPEHQGISFVIELPKSKKRT